MLGDSLHRLSWGGVSPPHTPPPRRCAPRMDAFRVSPPAVNSRWWNPGERRGRPVLPVGARPSSPGGGPADKAREGGAPTGRTGPGVFRPKRNDERCAATRLSRDGSLAEPPPGELGRVGSTTGCSAGMDRRASPHRENWAAWVPPPAVQPGWIAGRAPTGRTGPGVFRPKRNDERCAATRLSRDGSLAEPPPGELGRLGFTTGC